MSVLLNLLTFLKVGGPITGCIALGGGVYFAAGIVPIKDTGKSLGGIFLLVKGTAAATNSNKELITLPTNTTTDKKTPINQTPTKNYFCQIPLDDKTTIEDKNCSLYNINFKTVTPKEESIDLHEKMFDHSRLTSTANSISATSHHILKVSQTFYEKLSLAKTEVNKTIKLVDTSSTNSSFGSVQELVNLNLKTDTDLKNPKANLFLARIASPLTPTTTTLNKPLTCKISTYIQLECKLHQLPTSSIATNNLPKTELAKATPITSLTSTNISTNKYLIVEITKGLVRVNDLKNKSFSITTPSTNNQSTNQKIADFIFDQLLVGQTSNTVNQNNIYPLTAKKATYIVKKITPTSAAAFTDIQSEQKNYTCKLTTGTDVNYDDSCVLKEFPTSANNFSYSTIRTQAGFTPITTPLNGKEFFLLTVDKNKLFNLSSRSTKTREIKVLPSSDDSSGKYESFALLQEVTPKKAIGNTNLLYVRYKSKEDVSSSRYAGQCFLDNSEALPCTSKKVSSGASVNPLTFDVASSASNASFNSLNKTNHFVFKFSKERSIKDLNAKELSFYTTDQNATKKITFDVIHPMGGNWDNGKITFFLESPKTLAAVSAS